MICVPSLCNTQLGQYLQMPFVMAHLLCPLPGLGFLEGRQELALSLAHNQIPAPGQFLRLSANGSCFPLFSSLFQYYKESEPI